MVTQNRKFNSVLLAGLFIGGAVALGYACGGDDTTGPAIPMTTTGAGGSAGATGTGGNAGTENTGGGGATNTGGGGAASTEGGAGTGVVMCTPAGTYDNKPLNLPADGGLPAL